MQDSMPHKNTEFDWKRIDASIFPQKDVERAYRKMMRKADDIEKPHRKIHSIFRIAAAAVILVMIPVLTLFLREVMIGDNSGKTMMVQATANGEIKTVYLPDSSKVVLNAGSVLFYPENFSEKDRRVCLSGEATFDIVPNKRQPFFVATSNLTVKVHGTLFNVQAYPDEPLVSATLCRGSIGIIRNSRNEPELMLTPGEEYSLDWKCGTSKVSKVNADEAVAWENGGIYLRSGDIHSVVRILERHFNVNIYLTTDKYDSAIITAKFINGESVNDILGIISHILPGMKYTIINSNIYIR